MKKLSSTILTLCVVFSVYAQQDLIEKVAVQAVEIDSLKRVVIVEKNNNLEYQINLKKIQEVIKSQQNMIKKLNNDLADLDKDKANIKLKDTQLQQKIDSVALLKSFIFETDKKIITERQKSVQMAIEEKEKGKNEILTKIENFYKNQSFDEFLKNSTKKSVQQDLQLVGLTSEIEPILEDLVDYFTFKELLENKFDAVRIKNAQTQLIEIKRESSTLENLKERIDNYQMFNVGLIETFEKILLLDQRETVAGMPEEIQKQKLNKILSEISLYIFNYDFIFSDYPFLSDIVLETIKRKQPDPDTNISDLLEKL